MDARTSHPGDGDARRGLLFVLVAIVLLPVVVAVVAAIPQAARGAVFELCLLCTAAVALWVASVVIVALRLAVRHPHDRWISALLVGHWAWSALVYHAVFFTRINPAAWLLAAVFLGEAGLFHELRRALDPP